MLVVEKKKELIREIKKSKNIFIMAHRDLDLDAIGSSIGMYMVLKKLKKTCYLIIDDKENELGVSKILRELDGCVNVIESKTIEEKLYPRKNKNLLLILDTNKQDLVQSKKALDYFDRKIIMDHHELGKSSIKNVDLMIVDDQVSSTCEMVCQLIETYQVALDPYYCTVILAGIVLDTNNFTLKTSNNTFYAAYYLTSLGASVKKVQYLLKQDLKEYTERQKMLTGIKMINNNIAITKGSPYTIYRREDLAKMADTLLFFNEVEASFVIGKISKDVVGISGRSLGNMAILPILEKLGGGGDEYNGAAKFEKVPISKVEEQLIQTINSKKR